jgi:hypothetical protein
MLCRTLVGSKDPATNELITYLKQDMQYPCSGDEHLPVVAAAWTVWLLYAIGFPLGMAFVIAKDRAKSAGAHDANFWTSTTPAKERFWLPLVAHLQPEFWCTTAHFPHEIAWRRRRALSTHARFVWRYRYRSP